jgi:hypothetical protein
MDIVTRVCVHSISRPDLFAIVSEVFICWVHLLITDNDHPVDFAMRAFSSLRRQKRNTETGQERETERERQRDRERQREGERETERQRETERGRQRDRETERGRERGIKERNEVVRLTGIL